MKLICFFPVLFVLITFGEEVPLVQSVDHFIQSLPKLLGQPLLPQQQFSVHASNVRPTSAHRVVERSMTFRQRLESPFANKESFSMQQIIKSATVWPNQNIEPSPFHPKVDSFQTSGNYFHYSLARNALYQEGMMVSLVSGMIDLSLEHSGIGTSAAYHGVLGLAFDRTEKYAFISSGDGKSIRKLNFRDGEVGGVISG